MPQGERFLLVRAGESRFALPIGCVTRVVRSLRIFPVPGAGPQLLGLLQIEGEPMAVLHLGHLVDGGSGRGLDTEIAVIVRAGCGEESEVVGLAVDDALTVLRIPEEAIARTGRGLVAGEAVLDERLIRVLDPNALGSEHA